MVVIGAMSDGRKDILALVPGYRESTASWTDVLRDLRDCGRRSPGDLDGCGGNLAAHVIAGRGRALFAGGQGIDFPQQRVDDLLDVGDAPGALYSPLAWVTGAPGVAPELLKAQRSTRRCIIDRDWSASVSRSPANRGFVLEAITPI